MMLVAPQRAHHFNLKLFAGVIGLFGLITIISYFNELAKLGLLQKPVYPRAPVGYVPFTSPMEFSTAIQREDSVQSINVEALKDVLRSNTTRRHRGNRSVEGVDDVLSVSLHLDKHTAYHTVDGRNLSNGRIHVFQHKNTMPNYFTTVWDDGNLKTLGYESLPCGSTLTNGISRITTPSNNRSENLAALPKPYSGNGNLNNSDVRKFSNMSQIGAMFSVEKYVNHQAKYNEAVKVFLYQHELAAYAMRDCFKARSLKAGLDLLQTPVNQNYRQEWEMHSATKRNKYDAIFGGVSFGVCETVDKPCMYFTMITHPLDRILQVYYYCRESKVNSLCSFSKSNHTNMDLLSFIKNSGNTYFKKLLYYSKHCKLLGTDQVCIQDSKTSFILSTAERKVLLDDILSNLDKWFSVIGLVDHYKDSLKLFEHVLGLDFTACDAFNHTAISKYLPIGADVSFVNVSRKLHRSIKSIRVKLLKDPKVTQWLMADLTIYDEMVEIFQKQWAVYMKLKLLNLTGKHLARAKHKLSALSKNDTSSISKAEILLESTKAPTIDTSMVLSVQRRSDWSTTETLYSIKDRIRQRKHSKRTHKNSSMKKYAHTNNALTSSVDVNKSHETSSHEENFRTNFENEDKRIYVANNDQHNEEWIRNTDNSHILPRYHTSTRVSRAKYWKPRSSYHKNTE